MPGLSGLDRPCGTCGRRSGDHTLDEWAVCLGTTTLDLPFEEMPQDATAREAAAAVRRAFELDEDLIIADHFVANAMRLEGRSGVVDVRFPAVLHEFQIGSPAHPPVPVAKVLYVAGDPDGIRKYGTLVRDSANGAAKAVER